MGIMRRLIFLVIAAAVGIAGNAGAQSSALSSSPSSYSHNPIKLKLEDFTNPHTNGIVLPFGIDYSRETKSLVMPLDEQKHWGVGVNLDISNVKDFNANSWLGAELKKTPGVVLQRNF